MDSYDEYEKVETHISYSKRLQEINDRGLRYLKEIEERKRVNGRKRYDRHVSILYHLLENVIKPRVMLCNNLYSSLLYYLDEMLFYEVRSINEFVIEDDVYPLSFVYFNNSDWNPQVGPLQAFTLEDATHINDSEAALLMTLLQDYDILLQDLLVYVKSKKRVRGASQHKLFIKLIRIINRLKRRIDILRVNTFGIIDIAVTSDCFCQKKIEIFMPRV